MRADIFLLPGDGIGPEVTAAARSVLEAVARKFQHTFEFESGLIGGSSIDAWGEALTPETLDACRQADAVLLGAVGGSKWDDPQAAVRPEQGLLGLRKELQLFANLRPVRAYDALLSASPIRAERLQNVNLLIVRELTGGVYFGEPHGREISPEGRARALDSMVYWDFEVERVVELAFRMAEGRRKKVTSIDKANVLETSRLWRSVAIRVAESFPGVQLEHQLVDSAAMRLITDPDAYDVIVTENLFGDILADEASVLAGSLGMLPSASLGERKPGLYEPVHGSAPDIAGQGLANPLGAILSAAMLLRFSLSLEEEARIVESAVEDCLGEGIRTPDLGGNGNVGTAGMTEAVIRRISD
ncbi:MAG TPA: 3-isopropylmalate dehydrogenase [Anaerolineales bacterium]|nr:3-isopropylmalate dehydrogenase [Anaerolineales bacterium]